MQRKLIEGNIRESLVLYLALERIDADRSFYQVHAAPPLHPLPLVVLSADRAWGPQIPSMIAAGKLPADVPQDFGYVVDTAPETSAGAAHQACARGQARHQHEQRHEIHKEQPQLVIDAIREVVDAVRGGSPQLAR